MCGSAALRLQVELPGTTKSIAHYLEPCSRPVNIQQFSYDVCLVMKSETYA